MRDCIYVVLALLCVSAIDGVCVKTDMIIAVIVNHGFVPFAINLHLHTQRFVPPLHSILYIALDEEGYHEMYKYGLNTIHDDSSAIRQTFTKVGTFFRDTPYNHIVLHKWRISYWLLNKFQRAVMILDADVVFLRNPLFYLMDIPTCDLTVTVESFSMPTLLNFNAATQYQGDNHNIWMNTGLMLWQYTRNSIDTITTFLDPSFRLNSDDQNEFNKFVSSQVQPESGSRPKWNRCVRMAYPKMNTNSSGIFSLHVLPPPLFGSQQYIYAGLVGACMGDYISPYFIHFNFISGFEAKKKRMIEKGVWLL